MGRLYQLVQMLIGVMFFASGIEKLFLNDEFMAVVRNYALLPEGMLPYAAVIIPVIEIVSGGLVLLDVRRMQAVYLCGGLLLLYAAAISIKWYQGAAFDCGCGGFILGKENIGFRPVARNILLLGILYLSQRKLRWMGNFTSAGGGGEAGSPPAPGIVKIHWALNRFTIALLMLTIYFAYKSFNPSGENSASQEMERLRNENSLMKDIISRSWRNEHGSYENSVEGMKIPPDILSDSLYRDVIGRNTETGRILILFAASSSDCILCTKEEMDAWRQFMERVPQDKIGMVFLYYDRMGKGAGEFVERYGIRVPVIEESRPKFFEAMNIQRTPCIFIFDDRRRCLYAHIPLNENREKTGEFIRKIERLLN